MKSLLQRQLDAICARILHERRIGPLRALSVFLDWLAIVVPLGYFAFRLVAKGTPYEHAAEVSWEIVAAVLLAAAVTKIVLRIDEKAARHSKLIGGNISLATQAAQLGARANPDNLTVQVFNQYADVMESEDRESLGMLSGRLKRGIYREALKELGAESKCPICNASPWNYKRGSCQACGNTPASEAKV